MLRFAVLIAARLALVAPVALNAALEVVVLALAADPAPVREVKVLLGQGATRLLLLSGRGGRLRINQDVAALLIS